MASNIHRGDKQAKASPLNVSTAYLLNIFFRPASTLQRFIASTVQRFIASTRSEAAMFRRDPIFFAPALAPAQC
jgi:hypothetical protein